MNLAKTYNFGTGTSTDALSVGNYSSSPINTTPGVDVESWDGTSWTELTDTSNPRGAGSGQGSTGSPTSDFLATGAQPNYKLSEVWNGTSWTEVGEHNQARYGGGGAGSSSTSALVYAGGAPSGLGGPRNAETEQWNGTSWTEIADLSTARVTVSGNGATSSGSTADALCAGGETTTAYVATTEEWTFTHAIKTVTTS